MLREVAEGYGKLRKITDMHGIASSGFALLAMTKKAVFLAMAAPFVIARAVFARSNLILKTAAGRFGFVILCLFVIWNLGFGVCHAAIGFVQKVPNSNTPKRTAGATSLESDSFTSGQNNLLVGIAYTWIAEVFPLPANVTWQDIKGNSWVAYKAAVYTDFSSGYDIGVYIGYAVTSVGYGSGHTVTVSGFNTGTEISLSVLEFSGINASSPAAGSNSETGNDDIYYSNSLAPSGNVVYVAGVSFDAGGGGPYTLESSWSGSTMTHFNGDVAYATGADSYKIGSGTEEAEWNTITDSWAYYVGVIAAFSAQDSGRAEASLKGAVLRGARIR